MALLRVAGLLAALIGIGLRSASATVLVPMSDAELVHSSELVALAEVLGIESVEIAGPRIVTRITLGVEQMIKGHVADHTIVLFEPGGRVGDREVRIFAAPEFAVGEQVLVFLRRSGDGTLRTSNLALGKYRVEGAGRDAGQAVRSVPTAEVRDLDEFLATLGALVAGEPEQSPGFPGADTLGEPIPGPVTERFEFLAPPGALPARWFRPDRCEPVELRLANSDTSLGTQKTRAIVREAMAAWTNVTTASIVLENAGNTSVAPSVAGGICDGRSKIQFNDPFDELPSLNPTRCTGVLAVGGFCATGPTITVGGITFQRIAEGDVTVNARVGRCFSRVNVTETVAHELGHAIGLGHSSEDPSEPNAALREALLYAFAHHDGRGPMLQADDIAGLSTMYPVDLPDLDGDGLRDGCDQCPMTPTGSAVDSSGCACAEAGRPPCTDANPCTVDRCDVATAGCVYEPVDCADDEPCTADSCDQVTGACVNVLKGDSDGDGLCDPIDNCPLQADADPTDQDGDGVGDVCECADQEPGRCVPGRGRKRRRCLVEWLPAVTPPLNGKLLPRSRLQCTDGDSACDDDGVVDQQCTFRVALCIRNRDPRLPTCSPRKIRRLIVKSPNANRPKDDADTANADALTTAIDLDEQSVNRCSALLPIRVPTDGAESGRKRLKVSVVTDRATRGRAKLTLTCNPPEGG
jgi:hypothetical protein